MPYMKIPNIMYETCKTLKKGKWTEPFLYFKLYEPIAEFYFNTGFFDAYFEDLSKQERMVDDYLEWLLHFSPVTDDDEMWAMLDEKTEEIAHPDGHMFMVYSSNGVYDGNSQDFYNSIIEEYGIPVIPDEELGENKVIVKPPSDHFGLTEDKNDDNGGDDDYLNI